MPWNVLLQAISRHKIAMLDIFFESFLDNICDFNSSDASDRIFQFICSMPYMLMPWLLKSLGHQQVWFWQYTIGNM